MPAAENPTAPSGPLRFGPGGRFELRPAEYRLLIDGQPASLGGRALDLLMAMAARPTALHTKRDLLDAVWPGLVVEEGNLRVQINALRRLIGEDAIATVPGRGYRLSLAMQPQPGAHAPAEPPAAAMATAASGAFAPRLIGRDGDLARLEERLHAGRHAITLVGTPGVGKSSLARLALARWAGRGVWVDLAPLTLPGQTFGAIARALGASLDDGGGVPALLRLLAAQPSSPAEPPLLLVLDNAEHLIESLAAWAAQAAGLPGLRLLVTSQLPLAVAGEQVLRLEPLPLADAAAAASAGPQAEESALALLVERIGAADHRFRIAAAMLPQLRALCRQLDGLPLALEMAAARVPLMGLQAVHDALGERFSLLARGRRDSPARHRTLRDALDWSYGLLAAAEQKLFRAVGVFAGGFTIDLAVSLTADEHVGRWEVVDGLAALVERSLLSVEGEPPRYRLLETMRAFAIEKRASPGDGATDEGPSLKRRHAAAVLGLFIAGGSSEEQCLAEMDNAREAFLWARDHELAVAAQLSAGVAGVVGFTIWRQEVTEWMLSLRPAMEGNAGQALPPPVQAQWWSLMAYVLNVRRDRAATPAAERAVALWRQIGDAAQLQNALVHLVRSINQPGPALDAATAALAQTDSESVPRARVRVQGALAEAARVRGDVNALLACREEELRLSRQLGWDDMAQAAETNVCAALLELGRHAEAATRAQALLQHIDRHGGDANGNLPWALNVLVEALLATGRLAAAAALVPRSLAAGRRFGTTVAWQGILVLMAAQQRWEAAAQLAGYLGRLWTTPGAATDLDELARLQRVRSEVEQRLGDAAAALEAQGRSLDDAAAARMVVEIER